MNNDIKRLLEDIRLELDGLNRYKAFKAYYGGMGVYEVLDCDVIDLNFKDLIERIDDVLDNLYEENKDLKREIKELKDKIEYIEEEYYEYTLINSD